MRACVEMHKATVVRVSVKSQATSAFLFFGYTYRAPGRIIKESLCRLLRAGSYKLPFCHP